MLTATWGAPMKLRSVARLALFGVLTSTSVLAESTSVAKSDSSECREGDFIDAQAALAEALHHVDIRSWPGVEANVQLKDGVWVIVLFRLPDRPGSLRVVDLSACGSLLRVRKR